MRGGRRAEECIALLELHLQLSDHNSFTRCRSSEASSLAESKAISICWEDVTEKFSETAERSSLVAT